MTTQDNKTVAFETKHSLEQIEETFKTFMGGFGAASSSGLAASVATLTIAAVAFGAYAGYNKLKKAMDDAKYRLPNGDLLLAYHKMVELFEEHICQKIDGEGLLETPRPAFWQLREGTQDLLTHCISRDDIIKSYRHASQPYRPETVHFYQLSNDIVGKLVDSLQYEESKWLWKDDQRHPYVLFALEFIHWARTELLTYSPSSWVLARLHKRYDYLTACLTEGGELIPIKNKQYERQTAPYTTVESIGSSIRTLRENLERGRQYLQFKDAIYAMSAAMGALVSTSISAQVEMTIQDTSDDLTPGVLKSREDADRDDTMVRFSVQDIRKASSSEIKPYAGTLIFKRLKAFCDQLNLDSLSLLTCEEMPELPEGCVDALHDALEAIDANNFRAIDERGRERELCTRSIGLDDKIFTTKDRSLLLAQQKVHLKELAKWLVLKDTVAKLAKLHEFKGPEWAFGSAAGVRLLKKLMSLVEKGIANLTSSAHDGNITGSVSDLFVDGFCQLADEPIRISENQRGITARRRNNIQSLIDKDMTECIRAIKANLRAVGNSIDGKTFSKTRRHMQQIEAKIYANLGLLSQLYGLPQDDFQTLASDIQKDTIFTRESSSLDTAAHLYAIKPYGPARQMRLTAQLLKVLDLPFDTIIPFSLARCDLMLQEGRSLGHRVLASSVKLAILQAGANIMANPEASGARTFVPFTELTTSKNKIDALNLVFRLVACFADPQLCEQQVLSIPTEESHAHDFLAQLQRRSVPLLTSERPWTLNNGHMAADSIFRRAVRLVFRIATNRVGLGGPDHQLPEASEGARSRCFRILTSFCLPYYTRLYEEARETLRGIIEARQDELELSQMYEDAKALIACQSAMKAGLDIKQAQLDKKVDDLQAAEVRRIQRQSEAEYKLATVEASKHALQAQVDSLQRQLDEATRALSLNQATQGPPPDHALGGSTQSLVAVGADANKTDQVVVGGPRIWETCMSVVFQPGGGSNPAALPGDGQVDHPTCSQ